MKNFLTSLLGTLAGMVLFFGLGAILLFLLLIGIAATATHKQPVGPIESGSYLVVDLDMNITDAPAPFDSSAFLDALGQGPKGPATLQTREVVRAIQRASQDPAITGIFIEGQLRPSGYGTGVAVLREVRQALSEFRQSGKPVVAYLEQADFKDYYVASAADEVILDPYGALVLKGLGSAPMFYSGTLEKLGIGVQATRVGKYKSGIEPYTRKDLSPESREQLQVLLDEVWGHLREDVAKGRDLPADKVQQIADEQGLLTAQAALEAGLVTQLKYRDEVLAEMRSRAPASGSSDSFRQVALARYVKQLPAEAPVLTPGAKPGRSDARIAIVYAEGAIVDGFGQPDEVGGVRFAEEIRRLREDKQVKAIVLRVNSPGGSATASEHIQRELKLARDVKPVVVSMGSYAASGGYWISAYGDRLFAESTTITGSIGVYGVFFDLEGLSEKVGLTHDVVKTAKRADLMNPFRPKTSDELAIFEKTTSWIYDQFLTKVAEGRQMDRDRVHEIAQGRVWSGDAAVRLGLVDEIGNLDQAVAWAAQKANWQGSLQIEEFPRRKGFEEMITEALERAGNQARSTNVFDKWIQKVETEVRTLQQFNDPRGLYARLPYEINLQD